MDCGLLLAKFLRLVVLVDLAHLDVCWCKSLGSEIGWRRRKVRSKRTRALYRLGKLVLPTHPTCLSQDETKSQFQGYPPQSPSSSVPHSESIKYER